MALSGEMSQHQKVYYLGIYRQCPNKVPFSICERRPKKSLESNITFLHENLNNTEMQTNWEGAENIKYLE